MPGPWDKYAQQPAPWEKYAQPARPAGLPEGASLPGFPDQKPQVQMDQGAQAIQRLTGGNLGGNTAGVVGQHLKALVTAPYHAVADAPQGTAEKVASVLGPGTLPAYRMLVKPSVNAPTPESVGTPWADTYDASGNYHPNAFSSAMDAIPVAGPWARGIENDAEKNGALPAAAGLATDIAATKLPEVAAKLPGMAKTALVGDVNKPVAPGGPTARQRFNSADNLGVKLDAADATNSGLLKMVKKVNEHSLLGSGVYDAAREGNIAALQQSTNDVLKDMYPGDRIGGGGEILTALKKDQAGLQTSATKGFDSLPQDIPLPGLEAVGKTAQQLAEQNSAYHELFPSLRPNKAMGVVSDVGTLGPQPAPPVKLSPFVDESGTPIPSTIQAAPRAPQSFSVGQKLRSDLLEFRRKNNDIVAGQGDAMVGQLAGGVDDALTGGASQLTPEQLRTFRDANAKWADMKQTYDDPSSPLYHAVRTDNPSLLYSGQGLGPKTPENVVNLQNRLGNAIAPLRRGTVEAALKPTADGTPNFKTFSGNFYRNNPADYRAELFTTPQNSALKDISDTSNVLYKDYNPSGTAKLSQKIGEANALTSAPIALAATGHLGAALGTALGPVIQYPIARLMNSPGVVDWMMRPTAPVFPSPLARGAMTALPIPARARRD